MSAIEALTTATIIALSVSVSLSSAPSLDFKVSTLPSAFSMVPRTRMVCAVAAVHDAARIAPASANRAVLIMSVPPESRRTPSQCGGAHSIGQDGDFPFGGSRIGDRTTPKRYGFAGGVDLLRDGPLLAHA